ncbi:hypothetical protein ACPW96_21285 [Micromonospora sp. DT81.3]|uniref:hypothetical protein n=1 Tax=Micromonospora sp. DT81.3 TaxID=3416523 RepID=UPI003CF596EA
MVDTEGWYAEQKVLLEEFLELEERAVIDRMSAIQRVAEKGIMIKIVKADQG